MRQVHKNLETDENPYKERVCSLFPLTTDSLKNPGQQVSRRGLVSVSA